jgi:hypothetical protein
MLAVVHDQPDRLLSVYRTDKAVSNFRTEQVLWCTRLACFA